MSDPDADFSGVLNPKAVAAKRLAAAEGTASAASAPASGATMSQTQFTRGKPVDKEKQAKALAEALRNRK